MATLGSLGDLVLSLSADTAKFESDLGRAQTKAVATGVVIGEAIGKGINFAIEHFSRLTRAAIDSADQLDKMSQRVGIPVEQLSVLKAAAEIADVPVSALAQSFKQLQINAAAMSSGKGGKASDAFKAMGIDVKSFGGDTQKVFDAVLLKLGQYEDSVEKGNLATAVLGRGGVELLPLANEYEKTKAMAESLGITLDSKTTEAAARFKDNMKASEIAAGAMGTRIAAVLLPTLEKLSGFLVENAQNSERLDRATDIAAAGLKLLATAGTILYTVFITAGRAIAGTFVTLLEASQGNFARARTILVETTVDAVESIRDGVQGIGRIWDEAAEDSEKKAPDRAKKLAAPGLMSAEMIHKAQEAMKKAIMRVHDDAIAGIEADDEITKRYIKNILDLNDLENKVRSGQIKMIEDDPNNKLEVTTVSIRELGKQTQFATDDAKAFGFTFNSALEDSIINGKKASDVVKALDADIARMVLRRSVTEPLGRGMDDVLGKIFKSFQSNSGGPTDIGLTEGMTGGTFADGGRPPLGRVSLVGENGPELFVPDSAGTVVPGGGFGGTSVTVNQSIRIDSRTDAASIMAALAASKEQAKAEILAQLARGGAMSRAVR